MRRSRRGPRCRARVPASLPGSGKSTELGLAHSKNGSPGAGGHQAHRSLAGRCPGANAPCLVAHLACLALIPRWPVARSCSHTGAEPRRLQGLRPLDQQGRHPRLSPGPAGARWAPRGACLAPGRRRSKAVKPPGPRSEGSAPSRSPAVSPQPPASCPHGPKAAGLWIDLVSQSRQWRRFTHCAHLAQ